MQLQWIIGIVVGAIGALIGVYYRESIIVARKAKLAISRLDVLLSEFQYNLIHSPFKELYELGFTIAALPASGSSTRKISVDKGAITTRQEAYDKLREGLKSDAKARLGFRNSIDTLKGQNKAEIKYLQEKSIESVEKFEKELAFTSDEAFMSLPFHIVFQCARFQTVYNSVQGALEQFYRYAFNEQFDRIQKEEVLEYFVVRFVELTELATLLSQNIKSYRTKSIFGLTLALMTRGRVG